MDSAKKSMRFGIGIAMGALVAGALAGCAAGGNAGAQTYVQKCFADATTEAERSECAWRNAARMASGN